MEEEEVYSMERIEFKREPQSEEEREEGFDEEEEIPVSLQLYFDDDVQEVVNDPLELEVEKDVGDGGGKGQSRREMKSKPRLGLNSNHVQSVPPTSSPLRVPSGAPMHAMKTFSSKQEFIMEMNKEVNSVVREAVAMRIDPVEYHPFYLRMHKYILIGQIQGHVGKRKKDVEAIWRLFDEFAQNPKGSRYFDDEELPLSPYALYIQKGQVYLNGVLVQERRNEEFIKQHLLLLENYAKKVWKTWNSSNLKENQDIRKDLGVRLELFKKCQTIFYPSDVIAMNNLWKRFFSGFQGEEDSLNDDVLGEELSDGDVHVSKPPLVEELEYDNLVTNYPSLHLESDEDHNHTPLNFRPLSYLSSRKRKRIPGPKSASVDVQASGRKRSRNSSLQTLPIRLSASQPVPRMFQVKVVLVDIAKTKNYPYSVSASTSSSAKKLKSKKEIAPNPKEKRRPGRPRKKPEPPPPRKWRKTKKQRLTKKERKELEEKKTKRLMRYLKRWKKKWQWSIKATCRRRRKILKDLEERSEKVQASLERLIVTGHCKLHSLRNRKKWKPPAASVDKSSKKRKRILRSKKTKGASSSSCYKKGKVKKSTTGGRRSRWPLPMLKCDYCEKLCLGVKRKMKHMRTIHPAEYKEANRTRLNERKREQRRIYRETGEGPAWIGKEIRRDGVPKQHRRRRRSECSSVMCEDCGENFTSVATMRAHKLRKHSLDKKVSPCPLCPDKAFAAGCYLWQHFLGAHMNYDILQWSKDKGKEKGYQYKDIAGAGVQSQSECKSHAGLKKNGKTEHICDVCGAVYETSLNLKRHFVTKHTNTDWKCEICLKTFKAKDSRDAHVRQVHEGLDYRCDICFRKMQSKGKLWTHKVDFHKMPDLEPPEGLLILQCEYCGNKMLRGLEAHMKTFHPEKVTEFLEKRKRERRALQATYHNASSRMKSIMKKRELRRKWREEGIADQAWVTKRPPKKCPHCGIPTVDIIGTWGDHMINVHGLEIDFKKWLCPLGNCDKAFFTSTQLKNHVREHTKLDKKLKSEGHIQVITVEIGSRETRKEFICTECDHTKTHMNTVEEAMIHFIMKHPEIYDKCKGAEDPDLPVDLNNANTHSILISNEAMQPVKILPDIPQIQIPVSGIKFQATFACPLCTTVLSSDEDMRSHMEGTHPDDCWYCPEPNCGRIILCPEELEEHYMASH